MGSRKNGRLKHKDHAQDCGTLITPSDQHPAILPWSLYSGWHPSFRAVTGILPRPAAGLLLDDFAHDRLSRIRKSGYRKIMRKRAQQARAHSVISTTNVVLFEQRLVPRLVLPLDVIEERTACGDHFQKAPARMIVLHVGFEMPGEVIDAFRQDRDLNLGRAGVAGLVGIRLDDFRLAFGGNRHRQTLPLLRAGLAVSPVRLNTRLGMSSPLPISARARSRPATVT
jgi:hypothetical protein